MKLLKMRYDKGQSTVEYVVFIAAAVMVLLTFFQKNGVFSKALLSTYGNATKSLTDVSGRRLEKLTGEAESVGGIDTTVVSSGPADPGPPTGETDLAFLTEDPGPSGDINDLFPVVTTDPGATNSDTDLAFVTEDSGSSDPVTNVPTTTDIGYSDYDGGSGLGDTSPGVNSPANDDNNVTDVTTGGYGTENPVYVDNTDTSSNTVNTGQEVGQAGTATISSSDIDSTGTSNAGVTSTYTGIPDSDSSQTMTVSGGYNTISNQTPEDKISPLPGKNTSTGTSTGPSKAPAPTTETTEEDVWETIKTGITDLFNNLFNRN